MEIFMAGLLCTHRRFWEGAVPISKMLVTALTVPVHLAEERRKSG